MCEIYSKSTMKTPERRHWCCSSVFVVKSEQVSYIVLVFLLLTFNKSIPTEKGGHTYQHSPAETTYIITLTQFSPVLRFIKKPVICFAEQNEWLVSKSNATLNWNRLTYQHSPAETTYIITLTHFSSVALHEETSHLFCRAKRMTGFYIKRKTGLKWVKCLLNNRPVIAY